MGAYVKNINNLSQTFGKMKYFATLSLSLSLSLSSHRPYLASNYLILNSFTKRLSLFSCKFSCPYLSLYTPLFGLVRMCLVGMCAGHCLSPSKF